MNTDITIDIVPPTPPVEMTAAVVGVSGRMTDECLLQAHFASLCIIKAALLILGEYRTLVNPVPNVNLDVGGVVLPLATYLDVAAEAADAIAWTHSPS